MCFARQGHVEALNVWADSRGVFALVSYRCQATGRDLPSCLEKDRLLAGTTLKFNSGNGWQSLVESSTERALLSGFPKGPVILGWGSCTFEHVDVETGVGSCAATVSDSPYPGATFVVDETSAFSLVGKQVFEYRAGAWSLLETLPDAGNAIWADAERVIVAGAFQVFAWRRDSQSNFEILPEFPIGYYTAAWGFGSDELWFGNTSGQLVHTSGSDITILQVSRESPPKAIQGLWGQNGQLFFITQTEFGRVVNGVVELLSGPRNAPDPDTGPVTFRSLWGLSPSEVFLMVDDPAFDAYACGEQFALWFDGAEFHRF